MKKKALFIIIGILVIIFIWGISTYNKFVKSEEAMSTAWGQVENVYQRRADLVPNLVSVVKSYTEYEQSTLVAVTEARAKAMSTTVSADDMTEEQLQGFQDAQDGLTGTLSHLTAVVEDYPELKASENYLTLHAQLEGCENRIQIERNRFNEMAKQYNQSIRKFPNSIIAKMFGFEKRPYFAALTENADQAPKL